MSEFRALFDRARALSVMLLETRGDLKQLREDAIEQLCPESMSDKDKKEMKADIAEVFALAMIDAKDELRKAAGKIERRERIADAVGIQLALFNDPDSMAALSQTAPFRSMRESIAKGEVSISTKIDGKETTIAADGKGGVEVTETPTPDAFDLPDFLDRRKASAAAASA